MLLLLIMEKKAVKKSEQRKLSSIKETLIN